MQLLVSQLFALRRPLQTLVQLKTWKYERDVMEHNKFLPYMQQSQLFTYVLLFELVETFNLKYSYELILRNFFH